MTFKINGYFVLVARRCCLLKHGVRSVPTDSIRMPTFFQDAEANPDNLFPRKTHLLGDSAYPLKRWVLTPFRDNGRLTRRQKRYNFVHSSTRMIVERSLGLLKGTEI